MAVDVHVAEVSGTEDGGDGGATTGRRGRSRATRADNTLARRTTGQCHSVTKIQGCDFLAPHVTLAIVICERT